jgi:hypothetical protein
MDVTVLAQDEDGANYLEKVMLKVVCVQRAAAI